MPLSFALPRGSAIVLLGMARRRRPTCVVQSEGLSLSTNSTNFHEWGAASPENFVFGLIRVHSVTSWFKNVQRLNIRAGRAHSFSQRIRLFEKICSPETSSGSAVREKILAVHPPIRDRDSFSSDQRGRVE